MKMIKEENREVLYFKPKTDATKECCVCEHAETCKVEDSKCFHKNIHNLSRGSLYVHPCKLPHYCRHRNLENVTCKTISVH